MGDWHWRVVYRIGPGGDVQICEIWAASLRSDAGVYHEAAERIAGAATDHPELLPFRDVVRRLGRLARGIDAGGTPVHREPVPAWLADKLVRVVGMSPAEVAALDGPEAFDRWNDHIMAPGRDLQGSPR